MTLFTFNNSRSTPAKRHGGSGFTLIELLTVITVVAVLLVIAVPSFKYVTSANRASSEINGLLGDMQFARAEAIREGQTVTICASINGVPPCSVSTSWQTGWIVFSDTGVIGTFDGTDAVLKMQKTFSGSDTLLADHGITAVTYSREGFTSSLPTPVTFTLHTTPVNAQYTRCLSATIVGGLSTQIAGSITAEGAACN